MNVGSPLCRWPACECKTEKGDPCKFEDPDFYSSKQFQEAQQKEYRDRETAYAFLAEVYKEVERARAKFPSSACCGLALTEEVGELAQAMLKHAAGKWPASRVREEAVQVAAMALRCAIEGDPSLSSISYVEPEGK